MAVPTQATPAEAKRDQNSPDEAHEEDEMDLVKGLEESSPVKIEKSSQSQAQILSTPQTTNPVPAGTRQESQPQEETESDASEGENRHSTISDGTDSDLPPFDQEAFRKQYTAALKQASEGEDRLLEEFEAYSHLFFAWAQAGPGHDNVRASKRLRTQTTYVELEEESFKKKKAHYASVVSAFQKALDLLQQ